MDHGHWRVRRPRALMSLQVAGDQSKQRATIGRRDEADSPTAQVLVAGIDPLLLAGEVDPQLDAVEQPTADDELLRRLLDVQDSLAGRHPLGVAVGDQAAATV